MLRLNLKRFLSESSHTHHNFLAIGGGHLRLLATARKTRQHAWKVSPDRESPCSSNFLLFMVIGTPQTLQTVPR